MLAGNFEFTIPKGYCCFPNSEGKPEFYAAGTSYRLKECRKAFASMPDRIWLVRDPRNSHDPNAVKIMVKKGWHTYHVGFIPANESPAVSQLLKQRVIPIVQIRKIEADPRNFLFVFVLLIPDSVYLEKNPYEKGNAGNLLKGKKSHSGCFWTLVILLLLFLLPITMVNCEKSLDKSNSSSVTVQKPKPPTPRLRPAEVVSSPGPEKTTTLDAPEKQFLAEIESSVRKNFPFKDISEEVDISFVADNKETVSGKVMRVSEKGVLIAKTDGWTVLYDKEHLPIETLALFYKDSYEKFIKQKVTYYEAHIDTLTTKSGKTYQNCTVEKPTPYGLAIIHEFGGATIPYPDLPDMWRKRYHENELRAPAEIKKIEEQRAKATKAEAEEKFQTSLQNARAVLDGYEVLQIIKSGLLLTKGDRVIYVSGISPSDLTTGDYLKAFNAWKIGTTTYQTAIGGTNTVYHYTADTTEATVYYRLHPETLIFQSGGPK